MRSSIAAVLSASLCAASICRGAEVGADGINSVVTGLDGSGVLIGQVERFRPGKAGFDNDQFSADNVSPAAVYDHNGAMAQPNDGNVNEHATSVAGIIIGDGAPVGVAPGAQLHSAREQFGDLGLVKSFNHIATRTTLPGLEGDRMRAINYSGGRPIGEPDGSSYLTSFIDWSASAHDVTYVVAWPNVTDAAPAEPSDNYNGITVAASAPAAEGDSVFRTFRDGNTIVDDAPFQTDATGPRTSIDLLAPGERIAVLGFDDMSTEFSGTSAATPHVTGAVALLQQYAVQQIDAGNPAFDDDDSRRHEVMKAVLLNSADKLEGVHGSTRTIKDRADKDWTQSEAFGPAAETRPLDDEMGAGHLNVGRALDQYKSGATEPGAIEKVGWGFGKSGGVGDRLEWAFADEIAADDYIAVTLVWDRVVNKTGDDDRWLVGDQFLPFGDVSDILSNLNLYLMPQGEDNLANAVAASISFEDNVEHIFFKDHGGGDFKIVVDHEFAGNSFAEGQGGSEGEAESLGLGLDVQTDFALAWWALQPDPFLLGDANGDGVVDGDDLIAVQTNFGNVAPPTPLLGDADGDGDVDGDDLIAVNTNFGASLSVAVPEPASLVIALLGIAAAATRRPRG